MQKWRVAARRSSARHAVDYRNTERETERGRNCLLVCTQVVRFSLRFCLSSLSPLTLPCNLPLCVFECVFTCEMSPMYPMACLTSFWDSRLCGSWPLPASAELLKIAHAGGIIFCKSCGDPSSNCIPSGNTQSQGGSKKKTKLGKIQDTYLGQKQTSNPPS